MEDGHSIRPVRQSGHITIHQVCDHTRGQTETFGQDLLGMFP